MREPRSLFAASGNDSTPTDTTPDQPSLDTAQHCQFLSQPPDHPPPALGSPFAFLEPQDSWTRPSPPKHRQLHQRSGSAPLQRRPQPSPTLLSPALPTVAGTKRAPPDSTDPVDYPASPGPSCLLPSPATEPLHKRRRALAPSRYTLDRFTFSKSAQPRLGGGGAQPPSPLFFSSRTIRLNLPPRFSSSEAAARMLSKTREDSSIKTVTLARGTYSGLSPPGATSVASGRSSERSSLPRTASPDSRDKNDPLRVLASIGIVELLEQDDRPTFIVDVGEIAHQAPHHASIPILFANNALRSNPSAWELVAGKFAASTPQDAAVNATHQFRAWLLNPALYPQDKQAGPLPVDYGGILWSCFTLRKRLRVVTGHVPGPATILPSTDIPDPLVMPSISSVALASASDADCTSPSPRTHEAQDYFGNTAPAVPEEAPKTSAPASPPMSGHSKLSEAHKNLASDLPSRMNLTAIEDSAPFINECVLRAHAAGDVDPFYRDNDHLGEEARDMGFFDWTRLAPSPTLPKHIQFARSVDWASTPLGPIEYWSNDLRAMCNLIM